VTAVHIYKDPHVSGESGSGNNVWAPTDGHKKENTSFGQNNVE
jgi:hypothetical protein